MARKAREKGGGGRLARSETVTIRLDPRLNYLCEIAARVQRRTKSSFIEAAIDDAIHRVPLQPRNSGDYNPTVGDRADDLWNVREHERLVALAFEAPHLMTMFEQEVWAVICEHGPFWRCKLGSDGSGKEVWSWECEPGRLVTERIAECWNAIVAVAEGEASGEDLPSYERERNSFKMGEPDLEPPF